MRKRTAPQRQRSGNDVASDIDLRPHPRAARPLRQSRKGEIACRRPSHHADVLELPGIASRRGPRGTAGRDRPAGASRCTRRRRARGRAGRSRGCGGSRSRPARRRRVRILHRPDHARQHRHRHLQRLVALLCGASWRASCDGQLRAVPVGVLLVAGEQHAELVHARHDLVHHDPLALLHVPVAPGELVHGQHGVVATGDRRSAPSAGTPPARPSCTVR